MASPMFLVIGWYLLIGMLVYLFVPRPPRAAEAFKVAEEAHPDGKLLLIILVASFWPLIIIGKAVQWVRKLVR